jgi:flagellar biosynthesis protein FlhB
MLNCKETSRLASESMDRSLPLKSRIFMKMHVLICRFCQRYFSQITFIREALRLADDEVKIETKSSSIQLSPEMKERIRERLREG